MRAEAAGPRGKEGPRSKGRGQKAEGRRQRKQGYGI